MDTWELLSDNRYKLLHKYLGPTLFTITISTIKKDKDSKIEQAKYQICVMGNLNPHNWKKSDCFPPGIVSSQTTFSHQPSHQAQKNINW